MRRDVIAQAFAAILGLILLFGCAVSCEAQVKRVEMHIAGYLCGN